MTPWKRIKTIYSKELIDILRDRRTLIAMIVVPIVLYPLLMLGSIQAVSVQSDDLEKRPPTIFLPDEQQAEWVAEWIRAHRTVAKRARELEQQPGPQPKATAPGEVGDADLPDFRAELRSGGKDAAWNADAIAELVRTRQIQLGLIITRSHSGDRLREQYEIEFIFDPEEIRSAMAARSFRRDVLEHRNDVTISTRLQSLDIPTDVIRPYVTTYTEITTPGSILGQILPLVLVLMTITGAIYPAIDLTAGERERGTLETLMVCPVPVAELVVGKFLVVTTVAIMGAALNLASVSATVYFGGFAEVIQAPGDQGFPLAALPIILLSLIPFAILMSAIMIAVCSYARTFKEAQNYVTPVILAVLIPGGLAALPTARLEGVMTVVPVANMVLFTREMLLGSRIDASVVMLVLLSTSMYATAAVVIATRIFGTESVTFSDSTPLKAVFDRRLVRPSRRPTLVLAALLAALLFPVWFYVQSAIQMTGDMGIALRRTGVMLPLFFVGLPLLICAYFKISPVSTFALRLPPVRFLVAAVLIGASAWAPAHELSVLQQGVLPTPDAVGDSAEAIAQALSGMSPALALLLLAVIPAVCEEAMFRGFLLSGLSEAVRKWTAIVICGCVFAAFHFYLFKFPVTAILGILLAFLCWQSASIWPPIIMHTIHNGILLSMAIWPRVPQDWGIDPKAMYVHLPWTVLVPACAVLLAGLLLIQSPSKVRLQPQPAQNTPP